MRLFNDITGREIVVDSVRGENAYSGMIEGTPYLVRKFRVIQAHRLMEVKGNYVHNMEELERDQKGCDRDSSEWPKAERWEAKLYSKELVLGKNGSESLKIFWYQDGGDPMEVIKSIVANIDFYKYSIFEEWDDID